MEELIDKGALSEEIESLTVHVTGLRAGKGVLSNFMDEYRKSVLRIIDEQPTTTESEIRAKAIDDFLKALEELTKKNWIDHLEYGITWAEIDNIAKQLKEE